MMESKSGVTEGGKNTESNEHNKTNTKPQAKKQRFLKSSQKRNSSYTSGGKRCR